MNGTIEGRTRVYPDANAFIEAFEGRSSAGELLRSFLGVREASRPPLVTSELSLGELLVKPLELGRRDLVDLYESVLVGNETIEVAPIARVILCEAAVLRSSDKALKLPDAIHLATALRRGCTHFITGDRRIKRGHGLNLIRFDEPDLRDLLERLRS